MQLLWLFFALLDNFSYPFPSASMAVLILKWFREPNIQEPIDYLL